MFQSQKYKSGRKAEYKNMLPSDGRSQGLNNYHLSPGASTGTIKGNEADRLVRCRICGFPCDKERDPKSKDNTWAGLGIAYGEQLTADAAIGDAYYTIDISSNVLLDADGEPLLDADGEQLLDAGDENTGTFGILAIKKDNYYERTIVGGCPNCACLTYHV